MKGGRKNYEKAKRIADKYRQRLRVEINKSVRVEKKQSKVHGCGLIFLKEGDKGYDKGHRFAIAMWSTKKLDSHRHLEGLKLRERPEDDGFLEIIVTERPMMEAFSYADKYRPALAGVSIGHYAMSAGTLGSVVCKDSTKYILSNNHVLANSNNVDNGDDIYQPGVADGGTVADKIGDLDSYVFIDFVGGDNLVDAALCDIDTQADGSTAIMNYDYEIQGTKDLRDWTFDQLPLLVAKVGRTTEYTQGWVLSFNFDVEVEYSVGAAVFIDQLLIETDWDYGRFSAGGDSGSVIFDPSDMNAVGLLFAGTWDGQFTLANHIGDVVDALSFTFCSESGSGIGTDVPIGFRPTYGHLLHRIIDGVLYICETCCQRPPVVQEPVWPDCRCILPDYWDLDEDPPFLHVHVNEFKKWIFDTRCATWLEDGECEEAAILACKDFIYVRDNTYNGCYYMMGWEWERWRDNCTYGNGFWTGYYWSDGLGLAPHRTEFDIGCDCCWT